MRTFLIVITLTLMIHPGLSIGDAQSQTAKRCAALQDRIDSVNRRMRNSYTGKQGENLKERLRALKDRLHTCRKQDQETDSS